VAGTGELFEGRQKAVLSFPYPKAAEGRRHVFPNYLTVDCRAGTVIYTEQEERAAPLSQTRSQSHPVTRFMGPSGLSQPGDFAQAEACQRQLWDEQMVTAKPPLQSGPALDFSWDVKIVVAASS
jgi:hypothetical protein